jgi:oxidase EvaA
VNYKERIFLESALSEKSLNSLAQFFLWLESRSDANRFEVNKIPLNKLKAWHFEEETGNLVHQSGKFFKIEGINVYTNFGSTPHWMQPIINQPEIGILGFLTKRFNGILHFLVQAKMEPGNVNILQLSPTVQATRSNFTQVHGGVKPRYLEYFLDTTRAHALVDQLQSEQGSRFLRKRNRNIIIEMKEHDQVELHDDFFWLTLAQIFELLKVPNLVNMDSRTVLSCVRYANIEGIVDKSFISRQNNDFHEAVLHSAIAEEHNSVNDFDTIVSWLTHMKTRYELHVYRVPLNQTEGWSSDGVEVKHRNGKFFSVIGVSVSASNREVRSWEQPLIESVKGGIICFLCQKKNDILHFIVQARVEPGNFDCVEMAPTLQCTPSNYDSNNRDLLPPFYDLVMNARTQQVRYNTLQSEEGGRFYHDQNRYIVIELDADQKMELPDNYVWMTIRQMKEFLRFNNYLNIEARGLISCISVSKRLHI